MQIKIFSMCVVLLICPGKCPSKPCVSNFTGQYGVLESKADASNLSETTLNCTWTIVPPPNSIMTIKIEKTTVQNYSISELYNITNLTVSGGGIIYREYNVTKPDKFSIRGSPVIISLLTNPHVNNYTFHYSFRNSTICENYDFECADKHGCYNAIDICNGMFSCQDHSDETDCGGCTRGTAPCTTMMMLSTKHCFDPIKERCDGIYNCPMGEDEDGCSTICDDDDMLNCFNSTKCFTFKQRCDGKMDCPNGFDEYDCPMEENKAIDKNVILVTAVGFVLSIGFVVLIWRWYLTRRDINELLNNLPQMPLPPFRGPGDRDECIAYNVQFSESDYMHGGEIYEAFARARRRIGHNGTRRSQNFRDRQQTTASINFYGHDAACAAVALASLGIPTHLCVGLTVQEIEEEKRDSEVPSLICGKIVASEQGTGERTKSDDTYSVLSKGDASRFNLSRDTDFD